MEMTCFATTTNTKTGNIPYSLIGASYNELRTTCEGCPLLTLTKPDPTSPSPKHRRFGFGCYYHYGLQRAAWSHIAKARQSNPRRYTLTHALDNAPRKARYFRMAVGGDPAALTLPEYDAIEAQIRKEGLGLLAYTHFAQTKGAHLVGRALASCDAMADAVSLIEQGWRTFVHLKIVTERQGKLPNGARWYQCPADYMNKTCNQCGMCDPSKSPNISIIVTQRH